MKDFSSDEPQGGLFRGKEGRSFLVLLAIMIAGWTAFVFIFSRSAAPEPLKPRLAVEVEPLPPPDPDPAFQALRDKTGASESDSLAKEIAFKRARELSPEKLDEISRRGVTPQELCERPSRYRGLPIHFEGFARLVSVDEEAGFTPSKRFYEIWMTVAPDRRIPCCVLAEEVPKTLPEGRDLEEKVVFDGYFLRLLKYRAVDSDRFAPLLIGKLRYSANRAPAPEKSSIWWNVSPLVLLIGYVGFRMFGILRRQFERTPRRVVSPSREKEIEPDALNAWIAGEAPASDDDDPPPPHRD